MSDRNACTISLVQEFIGSYVSTIYNGITYMIPYNKMMLKKIKKFSTVVEFFVEKMIRCNNERRHLLFTLTHWMMWTRPYFEIPNSLLVSAAAICYPYICVFNIIEKLLHNVFNNDAVSRHSCQTFQTLFKLYISHSCICLKVQSYSAWKMLQ